MNMPWAFVVLVIGTLFILCGFTAVQRYLHIKESRQGKGLEERLSRLEEEIQRLQRAIAAGSSAPIRKAGY